MIRWIRTPVAKRADLNSIPGSPRGKRKELPPQSSPLTFTWVHRYTHMEGGVSK